MTARKSKPSLPAKPKRLTCGPLIRGLREAKNISAVELAKTCGVTRQVIYAVENDRYTPGKQLAAQLATALDFHPGILMFPTWPE